jgi:hypothetical protein
VVLLVLASEVLFAELELIGGGPQSRFVERTDQLDLRVPSVIGNAI